MNRRNFIRQASFASVSLLTVAYGCDSPPEDSHSQGNLDLNEVTIDELQSRMEKGELTSEKITRYYLRRIQKFDREGVKLNAVIEVNPDAIDIAKQCDLERRQGRVRGPLHGIPVMIKDNIDTADKMMTTAGSLALHGHIAREDAFIVKELRKAGAVLIGKTNLSEWANFRSTRSTSGWSSRGGQTKNPYVLDRSPCGSSSGSGTAVAANLCVVAIGTETNGSISCPSSMNALVGIKPTVGLWSRRGIIPISHSQDTAGPMARTVKDATILLRALGARDENDAASSTRDNSIVNYMSALKPDGLSGKRIGVERSFLNGHEAIDVLMKNAIAKMKAAGAIVVEVDLLDKMKDASGAEFDFLKFEFKDGLNNYLKTSTVPVKSLEDVITFNSRNEDKAMPFFKQEILIQSQEAPGVDTDEYRRLHKAVVDGSRNVISSVMQANQLDAICGPANGPPWCIDPINGDAFTGYGMYSPAAMAGYPSITVPMGEVQELPIGLCFFGLAYEELRLIEIAFSFEQIVAARKAPKFISTI